MLKLIRTPQKYVQGKDALNEFAKYAKDYGNRFLFVSSKRGLNDCQEKIEKSFEGTDAFRKYEIFSGISSNGEIVAFGTIVQLLMESAPKDELMKVMDFCYKVGLPITLKDMNIKAENIMIGCEKACAEGETIHNVVGEITPERLKDFVLTADILGRRYYESHK